MHQVLKKTSFLILIRLIYWQILDEGLAQFLTTTIYYLVFVVVVSVWFSVLFCFA